MDPLKYWWAQNLSKNNNNNNNDFNEVEWHETEHRALVVLSLYNLEKFWKKWGFNELQIPSLPHIRKSVRSRGN